MDYRLCDVIDFFELVIFGGNSLPCFDSEVKEVCSVGEGSKVAVWRFSSVFFVVLEGDRGCGVTRHLLPLLSLRVGCWSASTMGDYREGLVWLRQK